jgi:MFS family permease
VARGEGSPSVPRPLRALAFRNYRLFWASGAVSSIGTHMQIAALAWVVAVSTRSAYRVGLIAFAGIVPLLFLSPIGGAMADRFARRRLLLVTNALLLGAAVALWATWVAGAGTYWVLFAIAALTGVLTALQTPSWQSLIVELVPREHLQNAITLNSTQFNLARALGPMAAGVVLARGGAGWCFALNAASFVAVIACLAAMHDPPATNRDDTGLWRGLREALATLRADPGLRTAIGTHAAFSLLAVPVVQLIPNFALEVLGVGPEAYGLLLGALGIGAVGAGLGGGLVDGVVLPSRILAGGLGLGVASLVLLGTARTLPAGVVAMVVFGAAYVTVVAIDHSTIQRFAGDRLRGRITSLWLMCFGAFMPAGTLIQGAATDRLGARVVLLGDATLLLVVLTGAAVWQVFAHIDREETVAVAPN